MKILSEVEEKKIPEIYEVYKLDVREFLKSGGNYKNVHARIRTKFGQEKVEQEFVKKRTQKSMGNT